MNSNQIAILSREEKHSSVLIVQFGNNDDNIKFLLNSRLNPMPV